MSATVNEAEASGLVPLPRHARMLPGRCDIGRPRIVEAGAGLKSEAGLAELWFGATAQAPDSAAGAASQTQARADEAPSCALVFRLDPEDGKPENYVLSIQPGRVEIIATAPAGIFYGLVSLRQLALTHGHSLPAMRIEDGPRFSWRGFMLDTARNFFRVEFIEKMLDAAAFHKLNLFHWHLTDDQAWRLEIPSHPELTAFGSRRLDLRINLPAWKAGSYSPADVARVVQYAAARHITVVPEIETPGHALALLASHPELSCRGSAVGGGIFLPEDRYGVFDDILCAGNDRVFSLLADVFDHVAAVFPGPWVHAGGDEAPKARWDSCPRCRARMKSEGLRDASGQPDAEKLQAWFMDRVAALLAERGKRMVGWDEVLDGGVRGDTVIMSWQGYSGGIAGVKSGYDVVMSPQTSACYLDHKHLDSSEEPGRLGVCTVRDSYSFEPEPAELAGSGPGRGKILGAQANIWTEFIYFGRQAEYMAFPRLCALCEVFWSPAASRDFDRFTRRITSTHGPRLDALGINRYRGSFG